MHFSVSRVLNPLAPLRHALMSMEEPKSQAFTPCLGIPLATVFEMMAYKLWGLGMEVCQASATTQACQYGHLEVARLMIEARANVQQCTLDGMDSLIEACRGGYLEAAVDEISIRPPLPPKLLPRLKKGYSVNSILQALSRNGREMPKCPSPKALCPNSSTFNFQPCNASM